MVIGIVGGREKNEAVLQRMALHAGHYIEFHPGHMGGRGCHALESLVDRADLVVVITDINSHGSVQHARRLVRQRGVRLLLVRKFGIARLATLLEALNAEAARSAPALAQAS
jgi:hypothetical protein